MKVYIKPNGTYVMGVFASVEASCLLVVKFHNIKQKHILIDYVSDEIDIDNFIEFSNFCLDNYKIKHVFGNTIGTAICKIKNRYSNDNQLIEGYEIISIEAEHMMFLVQGHLKNLSFNENLIENWNQELKNFDINALRNNTKTYPRVFALAAIIEGIKETNTGIGWYSKI